METDPSGQLSWLVNELDSAETAGERVWLLGHIPMVSGDAFHDASNHFNQIVQRYDATIGRLVLRPHPKRRVRDCLLQLHRPECADCDDDVVDCSPADSDTGKPDLSRLFGRSGYLWRAGLHRVHRQNVQFDVPEQTYLAEILLHKEAYGSLPSPPVTDSASEPTPAFWHNVTALFESDDSVFQDYISRKSGGWDVTSCTGDCKTSEICQLRAAEAQYNCLEITPGIF